MREYKVNQMLVRDEGNLLYKGEFGVNIERILERVEALTVVVDVQPLTKRGYW